ncbi:cytochrome c oxidase assembly protein [Mycolicibacterium insubricum]|uniref:Copper resistance protein CopD n=1 Tax=Mycolicibacterium insubricum TaxID=444597 RepID=A0A1X0DHF5_9MYCO|nr:cytochrome c oxidase assembly protein [Mycolicibacterium insubricum]ORA71798.1 hypothetical protein BST26_07030 [Mycolicibacterium insubricum]
MSDPVAVPLTPAVAVSVWLFDPVTVVLVGLAALGYWRAWRSAPATDRGGPDGNTSAAAWCFGAGLVLWLLTGCSAIAVYAPVLFWMRALQVLVLMFAVPLLLACGRPVATVRAGLGGGARRRLDDALASTPARMLISPAPTALVMLGTPWLLYLTPWYVASMTGPIASATRVLLVLIGFGYFYSRIQADPVPHRYSPMISICISVAESIGDGLLGVVLWLGPLVAVDYYAGLHRTWGPSPRVDQSIGAGILWLVADVLSLGFLLVLMRALRLHEARRAEQVDAELDAADLSVADGDAPGPEPPGAPWWLSDPQLRARFGR